MNEGGSYFKETPDAVPVLIERTKSIEEHHAEQIASEPEEVNVPINE